MLPSVRELRDLGLTDRQVADVIELCQRSEDEQRAVKAEYMRNYRANVRLRKTRKITNGLLKDLPSLDVPNGTSNSGRTKRRPRVPFPDPWPWPLKQAEAAEFDRFKNHALDHARLSADWRAALRNWLTSPYRKPNGGHSNGNGRRPGLSETPIEQAKRLADEWRAREADFFGAPIQGAPRNARGD